MFQISVRHMVAPESIQRLIKKLREEGQDHCADMQHMDVVLEDIFGSPKSEVDEHSHLHVRGTCWSVDAYVTDEDAVYAADQVFCCLYQTQRRDKPQHYLYARWGCWRVHECIRFVGISGRGGMT